MSTQAPGTWGHWANLKGPGFDHLAGPWCGAQMGLPRGAEPVPARNQMPLWPPARPPAKQASLLPAALCGRCYSDEEVAVACCCSHTVEVPSGRAAVGGAGTLAVTPASCIECSHLAPCVCACGTGVCP